MPSLSINLLYVLHMCSTCLPQSMHLDPEISKKHSKHPSCLWLPLHPQTELSVKKSCNNGIQCLQLVANGSVAEPQFQVRLRLMHAQVTFGRQLSGISGTHNWTRATGQKSQRRVALGSDNKSFLGDSKHFLSVCKAIFQESWAPFGETSSLLDPSCQQFDLPLLRQGKKHRMHAALMHLRPLSPCHVSTGHVPLIPPGRFAQSAVPITLSC